MKNYEMDLKNGFQYLMSPKDENKNDVLVLNQHGNNEKNTTRKRARILIERGSAKVHQYVPFTIQLLREMGEVPKIEIPVHKGTTHACLSNIGQNRTEFLLQKAIQFALQDKKVLFISTMVNERTLNKMIGQEKSLIKEHLFSHFKAINEDCMYPIKLKWVVEKEKPQIVVIDDWNSALTVRDYARETDIAVLYGLSTNQKLNRMPESKDMRDYGYHELDAVSFIGLNANQTKVLKMRYSDMSDKTTHRKNVHYLFSEV